MTRFGAACVPQVPPERIPEVAREPVAFMDFAAQAFRATTP
jgi:hypothetical protein